MPGLYVPTSMVDRELDALIALSRQQRELVVEPPQACLEAFDREEGGE